MRVSEAAIMLLSVSGLQLVAVHLLGWPEPATITLQYIWDHLYSLYDIDALDEVEVVPFQLDEKEFKLREFFKVAKKSLKKEPTHTPEQPPDNDGKNLYKIYVANINQPCSDH